MGFLLSTWPLWPSIGAFVAAAGAITFFGWKLARVVDRLADRTGIGEAIAGAVLLGGVTSIAGLVVSIVAAADGDPSLAVSNSVGGIAVQTAFIAVADLTYRRVNLEHAAASVTNVFNSMLILILLAVVVLGAAAPPVTILGIHPATVMLVATYGYGIWISSRVRGDPMWLPQQTEQTRLDEPGEAAPGESVANLLLRLLGLAVVVAVSGWVIGRAGISIAELTGLSGTVVGTAMTSITTSLPELVTAIAAVRTGALTLAVGGIIGGNSFDVLFVAVADVVYQRGSVYEAMTQTDLFVVGWAMLLTGVLGAGLIRRQRRYIGFEGVGILALYVAGLATITAVG